MKLFYITNDIEVAKIAQATGVDRIFIDLEKIGKAERQGGMNTVQSQHSIDDIKALRSVIDKSEILVRSNPIHENYEDEIEQIIEATADIIMLPYFKTVNEVKRFLDSVNGRCKTMLLFETVESIENIDDILNLNGIDEVFIGLNDLSLGYGNKFMFELLSNGVVEEICLKFRKKGFTYGFGGMAAIGTGMLPAEAILKEHYRLGSSMVILARAFCNTLEIKDLDAIRDKFTIGVNSIRSFEREIKVHSDYFAQNQELVKNSVNQILANK